ncbi:CBS domain-containing protein [Oxalobacteraceae bacterium OM1]|nr:CBS domain-containing protein [Oxalobacteraceae bacterium OM1]
MPISECCNLDVVRCDADTPVQDVAALMRRHHVGAVVVVEEQPRGCMPVGIVTDRDIVIESLALGADATVFTAGDMMTSPVATVNEREGIVETLQHMREHKVRRMPVVRADGTLYGLVSADDIVSMLSMELSLLTGTIVEQPHTEQQRRRAL